MTNIDRKGEYNCYIYIPKVSSPTTKMNVTVNAGKSSEDKVIKPSEIIVEGQTSGEWVLLGKYALEKGDTAKVTVAAKGSDGQVVADAIIWTPVK